MINTNMKTIAKLIQQRSWIAHIDTDEPGNYIVTLHEPFCFHADPGCGVRGFDSLVEVRASTRAQDVYEKPAVTFENVEADEVTPELEALVLGIASGIAQAKQPAKRGRKSMLTEIRESIESGKLVPLEFKSAANYTYNRRADQMFKLAMANDVQGLEAIEVNGVNTYAKALLAYRNLLITHVKAVAA